MRVHALITPIVLASAVLLSAPISAETVGEDAALCKTGRGPALQVNVQGLKDRTGELWLELYPANQTDYLRSDDELIAEGKVFRRAKTRIPANGTVEVCLKVPRAGRYALMLRHNRVGRDKFSFWSDGAGVPGNKSLGRSKPTLDQAAIDAGGGVTSVTIKLQYLRGFGFSPLG